MHTIGPLNGLPPSQMVERLLGKSYQVVKTVYLNLDTLKEIYGSKAINYFYNNLEEIREISEQADTLESISANIDAILDLPQLEDKLITTSDECISKIQSETQTAENKVIIVRESAVDTINNTAEEAKQKVQEEASTAMFSYRYLDTEFISSVYGYPLSTIHPSKNLKAGDHVVTPSGDVHEVAYVSDSIFTLGEKICTLKGDKGDTGLPGTGLQLYGVYDTVEDFLAANLKGTAGAAYQILNRGDGEPCVYLWDVNAKAWKDVGQIRGIPGSYLADTLITPDLRTLFVEIYTRQAENIPGVEIPEPLITPDLSEVFLQYYTGES
jgi:hypothetical protein